MGLASRCLATYLGMMHKYPKNIDLGWQNAVGDGKHLDHLKAMELHVNSNHVEAAQSWHTNKASPLDGEC